MKRKNVASIRCIIKWLMFLEGIRLHSIILASTSIKIFLNKKSQKFLKIFKNKGVLKMEKVNVTCPCCGAKTDMKFETMILAQDKKTVKKLLDRSLFSHKCSSCKQNFEYYNTEIFCRTKIQIIYVPKESISHPFALDCSRLAHLLPHW